MRLQFRSLVLALALVLSGTPAFAAFAYYKTFTTDATQSGTADSTNFPITISVTDADLKTVANGGYVQNANGYDIRPYSDSGLTSALTFELVYYNASTGQVEMHVKVGTLSHTTNLVSYLAFGDSGISTNGSSTSTWNANAKLVWHAKDGTTLGLVDSTTSTITLVNHSATVTSGQIDGAANINSNYLDADNDANLNGTGAISISAWVNIAAFPAPASNGSTIQSIAVKGYDGTRVPIFLDVANPSSPVILRFGWYDGSSNHDAEWDTTGSGWTTGTWHYVVGTWDASTYALYFDGVSKATTVDSTTRVSNAQLFAIGATDLNGSVSRNWSGSLDEVRVWATGLSQSWVTSEYNNQKASSTFLTWGAKTATGGGGGATTSPTLPLLGVGPG